MKIQGTIGEFKIDVDIDKGAAEKKLLSAINSAMHALCTHHEPNNEKIDKAKKILHDAFSQGGTTE